MRLIDADALCTYIEDEFDGVCVYDVSGNEAAREFCDMVDIVPTIDAIPVGWISQYMNAAYGRVRAEIIREMLDAWMEQEAQDGNM